MHDKLVHFVIQGIVNPGGAGVAVMDDKGSAIPAQLSRSNDTVFFVVELDPLDSKTFVSSCCFTFWGI